jgi:hypothetical protein
MSVLQLYNDIKPFFKSTSRSMHNLYNTILVYKNIRKGAIVDVVKYSDVKKYESILIKYNINYYKYSNKNFYLSAKKISKTDINNIDSNNHPEIGKLLGYPFIFDINKDNIGKKISISYIFFNKKNKKSFILFGYIIPETHINLVKESYILLNKINTFNKSNNLLDGYFHLDLK